MIKNINEDDGKKTIYHLCDSSGGSSGSPIINKSNFQVIGIHKGAPPGAQNYNLGTFLKEPIEAFIEEIKRNNNNNKYNKDKNNHFKENEKVEMNKIIEKSSE